MKNISQLSVEYDNKIDVPLSRSLINTRGFGVALIGLAFG